jgi:tRNA modification GTPase
MDADTIFAVASGSGQAAIAVMRVSGPLSQALLAALCGRVPSPRRASFRRLRDSDGSELDQGMVVWLPGPRSYTGEDSAELYLHGGRAVLTGVASALVALGARPAEPGEFTRRAFLNGRMDLTEAEAVHDLIAAETAAQRRQALRQLDGALGTLYGGWAVRLRLLLAQQEALIDFPDEDLPADVEAAVEDALAALQYDIAAHLDDRRRGERLREGLVFAVTGRPNVGKSSLVNALAERDVAIVSALPGTTRDALETRIVLGGVPVTLVDTAGLRDTTNEIEAEGVRRAYARAAAADLIIDVVEATPSHASTLTFSKKRGPDDSACAPDGEARAMRVLVANKVDLGGPQPMGAIGVSALTGQGLDILRAQLGEAARSLTESTGPPSLTQSRHRAALAEAATRLASAQTARLPELRAEDLRLALRALGRITGSVDVEDILDTLFARFCIGK